MPKIVDKKELKILEPNSEKKKIYDEEIAPLLDKLKLLCEKNNFPVFITLCIDPNAKVTYKDAPTTKNLMNSFIQPDQSMITLTIQRRWTELWKVALMMSDWVYCLAWRAICMNWSAF